MIQSVLDGKNSGFKGLLDLFSDALLALDLREVDGLTILLLIDNAGVVRLLVFAETTKVVCGN